MPVFAVYLAAKICLFFVNWNKRQQCIDLVEAGAQAMTAVVGPSASLIMLLVLAGQLALLACAAASLTYVINLNFHLRREKRRDLSSRSLKPV